MSSSQQFLHSVGAALLARSRDTLAAAYQGLAAVGQDMGQEVGQGLGLSTAHDGDGSESCEEASLSYEEASLSGGSSGGGESLRSGRGSGTRSGTLSASDFGTRHGSFSSGSGAHGGRVGRRRGGEDGGESEDSAWGMDVLDVASEEGPSGPTHERTAMEEAGEEGDGGDGEEGGARELSEGVIERAKGHLAALTEELSANKADLAEAYAMLAKAGCDWAQEQQEKARLEDQVAGLTAALQALQATGGCAAGCPPPAPRRDAGVGPIQAQAQGVPRGGFGGEGGRGAVEEEVARLRWEVQEERRLRAREWRQSESAQAVIVGSLKWVTQVKEEVEREKEEVARARADLDAAREALERERRELQLADSWREYNVRVKLLDAQMELGERVGALEDLESALSDRLRDSQTGPHTFTLSPPTLLPPQARDTLRRLLAPFHDSAPGSGPPSPAPSPFDIIYGPRGVGQETQPVQPAKGDERCQFQSLREQVGAEALYARGGGDSMWEGEREREGGAVGAPQEQRQVPAAPHAQWGARTNEHQEEESGGPAQGVPCAMRQELQAACAGGGGGGGFLVFSSLVGGPGSSPSSEGGVGASLSSPRSPGARGELYGSSSGSSDGFGEGLQQPPLCATSDSLQAYVGPLLGCPAGGVGAQSIWDSVSGAAKGGGGGGAGACGGKGEGGVVCEGWRRSEAKRQLPALHDGRAAKMRGSSRGSVQPCVGS